MNNRVFFDHSPGQFALKIIFVSSDLPSNLSPFIYNSLIRFQFNYLSPFDLVSCTSIIFMVIYSIEFQFYISFFYDFHMQIFVDCIRFFQEFLMRLSRMDKMLRNFYLLVISFAN